MLDHRRKIVGVMIKIVAVAHLCGPAVTSPIMSDDAVAVLEKEQHLRVPIVG